MISTEALCYEYPGRRVLHDIEFTIAKGSITALAGPNGAGKTTLMRCLSGLDKPFSGKAMIDGMHVEQDPRKVHEVIGYLSDFFGLYDHLTVRQCLTYVAWSRLIPADYVGKHIDWLIALLGLEPVIDKKAGELSRGWRQRVGIAQSIIHNPKVLILDEPASGLDPESRHKLAAILKTLRDEREMTIMVSSHILAELEDYCDSMLILRNGRIIDHISASGLSQKTAHAAAEAPLKTDAYHIELVTSDRADDLIKALQTLGGLSITRPQPTTIHFDVAVEAGKSQEQHAETIAAMLAALVTTHKMPVCGFSKRNSRLQDLYMTRSETPAAQHSS